MIKSYLQTAAAPRLLNQQAQRNSVGGRAKQFTEDRYYYRRCVLEDPITFCHSWVSQYAQMSLI
jgi:hypothetical protein